MEKKKKTYLEQVVDWLYKRNDISKEYEKEWKRTKVTIQTYNSFYA